MRWNVALRYCSMNAWSCCMASWQNGIDPCQNRSASCQRGADTGLWGVDTWHSHVSTRECCIGIKRWSVPGDQCERSGASSRARCPAHWKRTQPARLGHQERAPPARDGGWATTRTQGERSANLPAPIGTDVGMPLNQIHCPCPLRLWLLLPHRSHFSVPSVPLW